MPVETRGQERRKNEKRKWEDRVKWIEDLPWEVIEKIASYLKPTDVLKLMMVNKRLYSGYAREESIVFGNHVHEIRLGMDCLIKKHPDSRIFELDIDHLHLIKRVTSCDELYIWIGVGPSDINEIHKTILEQLKSVNRLELYMTPIADHTKFFTHFHASVNEYANVDIRIKSFEKDQSASDLLGNFIETRLTDCEEISLDFSFVELFGVCSQALKKTRVKRIEMNGGNLFLAVQWIVKHGIPSKMPEAGFYTLTFIPHEKLNEIISFLTDILELKKSLE